MTVGATEEREKRRRLARGYGMGEKRLTDLEHGRLQERAFMVTLGAARVVQGLLVTAVSLLVVFPILWAFEKVFDWWRAR